MPLIRAKIKTARYRWGIAPQKCGYQTNLQQQHLKIAKFHYALHSPEEQMIFASNGAKSSKYRLLTRLEHDRDRSP
jgi:hypothetical protein